MREETASSLSAAGNHSGYSGVAQSVEQAAVNRSVVGSSPTAGVSKQKARGHMASGFFVVLVTARHPPGVISAPERLEMDMALRMKGPWPGWHRATLIIVSGADLKVVRFGGARRRAISD